MCVFITKKKSHAIKARKNCASICPSPINNTHTQTERKNGRDTSSILGASAQGGRVASLFALLLGLLFVILFVAII